MKNILTKTIEYSFENSNKSFYFAKINVNQNIFSADLDKIISEHIPQTIKDSPVITYKEGFLALTDVIEYEAQGMNLLIGNLTFTKPKTDIMVTVDKETRLDEVENLAKSALFIYDIESEILAYTYEPPISEKMFPKHFAKILEKNEKIGSLVINSFEKSYSLLKIFEELKIISSITISIIPPNPTKDHYNRLDNILDESESTEMKMVLKSNTSKGINFKNTNDKTTIDQENFKDVLTKPISDGVDFVEKGYGSISLKGINNDNKKISFSSKKHVEKISAREPNSEAGIKKIISHIKLLTEKFNK